MNLLLATPFVEPEAGGPATLVEGLARGLREAGQNVAVAANRDPSSLAHWRHSPPYGESLLHNLGLWSPLNHRAARLAAGHRWPQVTATMGMLDPWALAHKRWKKRLAWWAYQRSDLQASGVLHATAEREVGFIRESGLSQPVAVMPCGVEIPAAPRPCESDRWSEITFLCLSRIHPVKGLIDWVRACRHLPNEGWRARIAGPDEGGHRAEVEAAIHDLGLSQRFEFVGPVYDPAAKAALFASADVFVLPSHSENFGIVIAEAMAHGLPVITTTGTPWESLVKEQAGWWVPPTLEALAGALQEALALERPALRAMGLRGRALVEREFAWPVIIRHHLALYAWMLGHGPKPEFVTE